MMRGGRAVPLFFSFVYPGYIGTMRALCSRSRRQGPVFLVGMVLQLKSRRKVMLEGSNLCAPRLVSECNDEAIKVVLEV